MVINALITTLGLATICPITRKRSAYLLYSMTMPIDDLLTVSRLTTSFLLYFPNSEYIRRSRLHTAGRLSVPHFRINSLVFTPEPNYANALCGQKGQGCCEFLKEKTPPLGFAYSWVLAMRVDPKERRIPKERLGHLDFYFLHLGQTEEIPSEFCL